MIEITMTYNGQKIDSLEEGVRMAITDEIKRVIQNNLESFTSELSQYAYSIEVQVSEDYKSVSLDIDGIPEELIKRVESHIQSTL